VTVIDATIALHDEKQERALRPSDERIPLPHV
jgi:hypothetical protein